MRILITNHNLERRGGAQVFVRDLARGLQTRGHSVMVFSSNLKETRRLMESDVIPVTTDIEKLEFLPDLIHGQHHLDTMVAVSSLPEVPAIYHCHGAMPRHAMPLHPRIYRYFAMSRTLAERMQIEANIPAENIDVILNGVDLERYHAVRDVPEKPVRALVYHRIVRENSAVFQAIRTACDEHGIALDLIGYRSGSHIDHPEEVLPGYDLVFASGMSAIESMACGCAVVVLGRTSCGPLVTPGNFDHLRSVNFSIPVNSAPPARAHISREIGLYDAEHCRSVTGRLRAEAGFDEIVERLLGHYEAVVEQHRAAPGDYRDDVLALARYLRTIVPLIKKVDHSEAWQSDLPPTMADALDELHSQLARVEQELRAPR